MTLINPLLKMIKLKRGHHCWQGTFVNDDVMIQLFGHHTIPFAYASSLSAKDVAANVSALYPDHVVCIK